ncbi:MAG: site-specific integrase [Planctomycetes bacterium]|nr:site-specific integrase [Planctomycetota bacterium]
MLETSDRIRIGDHVRIYKRGKKSIWCADFWRDGQHCRQSLKTANEKVARQRALQLEVELATGSYHQPPRDCTFEQSIEDYLAFLVTENRAPKTLVKYRGILVTFKDLIGSLGVTRLRQFSVTHFDRFRGERKKNHHPKTMYTEGVVVKQFWKWCKSRKLVRENPLAEFKLTKPPLIPKEGPSIAQIDTILATVTGQFRLILAVLAFTGMRSGELQRLRKEDLDLVGNWLHVTSRTGAETKTKFSRKVPLHPRLRMLFQQKPRNPGPWLFTAKPSRKYPAGDHWIGTKKLNDRFIELLARLKLPVGRDAGFTIHSLRHAFETITVNAGIPQRAVDAWLGHHGDKSMAAVYYKLKDEESQAFMLRVPFGTGTSAACAGTHGGRAHDANHESALDCGDGDADRHASQDCGESEPGQKRDSEPAALAR